MRYDQKIRTRAVEIKKECHFAVSANSDALTLYICFAPEHKKTKTTSRAGKQTRRYANSKQRKGDV